MLVVAAAAIADCVASDELTVDHIIPNVFDPNVARNVADAVVAAASRGAQEGQAA
jgi:malate dehydrogenase (oxaloacetate-decarboxylating)